MGRMRYAPTGDIKKQKTNNERIRYPAKFPGLGEALIFFSHPFLASRQEKDVGARGQRPLLLCCMRRPEKISPFPSSCTRPCRGVLWGVCDTPLHGYIEKGPSHRPALAPVGSFCGAYLIRSYPDGRKWGIQQICICPCRAVCGAYSIRPYRGHQKRGILSPFEAIFVRIDGLPSRRQPRARRTTRLRTC